MLTCCAVYTTDSVRSRKRTRLQSKHSTASCSPFDHGICIDMLLGQQLLEAAGSLSVQEGCSVTRGNRQSAARVGTGSLMNVPLLQCGPEDALRTCKFQPPDNACTSVSRPAMIAAAYTHGMYTWHVHMARHTCQHVSHVQWPQGSCTLSCTGCTSSKHTIHCVICSRPVVC